jgi:hypothetical protein
MQLRLYRSTRKDSPFSRHFVKATVHFVCDQDLALTAGIRDLDRRFDRVRSHFFEIDVGSDFVLDVFWPPSRPVRSPAFMRTSPRVSAKAALTAPTHGECGVRFISRLRAWRDVFDNLYTTVRCYRSTNCGFGTYTHRPSHGKGESISVAGAV